MGDLFVMETGHLRELLRSLEDHGYQPVGPTIRGGAIVYDVLTSVSNLPLGMTDVQESRSYRLLKRADQRFFDYRVGMTSWKRFLHPPEVQLYEVMQTEKGPKVIAGKDESSSYALIGVRPCDLHAIAIQDTILLQEEHPDTIYRSRREKAFLVAVNCTEPGGTCFCGSMNTGPKAKSGFDLALTEIVDQGRHFFLVEAGSSRGASVLSGIPCRAAEDDTITIEGRLIADATKRMGRNLDTRNIQHLLYDNRENPQWDQVAVRCLSCGNCTLVCPTCFCTTVKDATNLAGNVAERSRNWSSCFSLEFSYIHGGSVRSSTKARYRHWITHKYATWMDQFGMSGCVGCGRCITWCPAGIDVTEELRRLREESIGRTYEQRETCRARDH